MALIQPIIKHEKTSNFDIKLMYDIQLLRSKAIAHGTNSILAQPESNVWESTSQPVGPTPISSMLMH